MTNNERTAGHAAPAGAWLPEGELESASGLRPPGMYQPRMTRDATITYGALVGRMVEIRRKQLGISQEPLARALGITQSAFSRLERGRSTLTVTQLRIIARHLSIRAAELLDEAEFYVLPLQGGETLAQEF